MNHHSLSAFIWSVADLLRGLGDGDRCVAAQLIEDLRERGGGVGARPRQQPRVDTGDLAIFGKQADAAADGVGRRAEAHRLSVNQDAAAVRPVGAGEHPRHLAAPCTEQPGDPENLARVKAERDVVHGCRR